MSKKCCLVHATVQRNPVHLDYRHLTGMTVLLRLGWGYGGGVGTAPPPNTTDEQMFIENAAATIRDAQGVDYVSLMNEPNNRAEWPGFGGPSEVPLTMQSVTRVYNEVRERVAGRVKMGPPSPDPYYGPGSDNGEWWRYLMANISGADALFLHAKTQYTDPALVWSDAKFTDDPLRWQFLNLRVIETYLAMVPAKYKGLPVYVKEVNPQRKEYEGGEHPSNLGWGERSVEWVEEACKYFRTQPVDGIVFYRWHADSWALRDRTDILGAIAREVK